MLSIFRVVIVGLLLSMLGGTCGVEEAQASSPDLPDLGVVMNIDGDAAYSRDTLAESEAALRAEIDRYAEAEVGTIVYCLGAGSEVMLYPTKVADTWGWRSTPYDDDPKWSARIARNKANQDAGGDAIRVAGEQAKQHGMLFLPSLRMNDAHYAFGKPPRDYPLTGSFYLEHPEYRIGESPIRSRKQYGELLDFTHAQVRQHRMDQIHEATQRYQDVMDGFELDFTRFQVFFPPDGAKVGMPLMTQLVRQTRAQLDELGQQNGRRYLLIVRIPPTLESCAWSGLDIPTWVNEGLVDVLVPSLMMTTEFDMQIEAFKQIINDAGGETKIYPTMMPRVGWRWGAFDDEYPASSPAKGSKGFTRDLSLSQLRGAALNLWSLGADGIYLFNFQHYKLWLDQPEVGLASRIIKQLVNPSAMTSQDLVFSVTKANWQDHEGTYENRKALPTPIASTDSDDVSEVSLLVGIDPSALKEDRRIALRLGLREVQPDQTMTIALNGMSVWHDTISHVATPAPAKATRPDLAQWVVDLPVRVDQIKSGSNKVRLQLDHGSALWTDLELVVQSSQTVEASVTKPLASGVESPQVVGPAPGNETDLVRLADDTLVLFYTDMEASQVRTITSHDNGLTWSEPRVEFATGRTHHAIDVFLDRDNALHVFYLDKHGKGKINVDYTINVLHRVCHNYASNIRDTQNNWSEPTVAFEGYTGALRGGLQLQDGRLLVPIGAWNHPDDEVAPNTGKNHITFVTSDDNGQTWTRSDLRLTAPVYEGYNGANYGAVEPSIIELNDGRLWLLIRTQTGFLYESFSNDGTSWADPTPSRFVSSNSPASMTKLDDGRIVMLWNNSVMPPRHDGDGVYGGRDALSAALSSDDGKTWQGFREVYRDPTRHQTPPQRGDRGTAYPTAVQAADGKIVIVTGQGAHVRRTLRVVPDWVTHDDAADDFSRGLTQWHAFTEFGPAKRWWRDREQGASVVDDPSAKSGSVLWLRRPDGRDGDGAVWNFPAAVAGRLELRVRVKPGGGDGRIALAEHFFNPTDAAADEAASFSFSLQSLDGLTPGEWHTLELTWDADTCRVQVDGQLAGEIATQRVLVNGVCYLLLRNSAGEPDPEGWQVDWVAMDKLQGMTQAKPQGTTGNMAHAVAKAVVAVGAVGPVGKVGKVGKVGADESVDVVRVGVAPEILDPLNYVNVFRLPDGTIKRVRAGGGFLLSQTSNDHGITWAPPVKEFPTTGSTNPVPLLDNRGELHYFRFLLDNQSNGGPRKPNVNYFLDIWHVWSENQRTTWPEPKKIHHGYTGSMMTAIQTSTGRFVLPFGNWIPGGRSTDPFGRNYTTVIFSDDYGRTWSQPSVKLHSPVPNKYNGAGEGAVEPTIVELRDGRLWMLMRSQTGRLTESYSSDDGVTWSEAVPSQFRSSTGPPSMVRLDDDRLVLLWNQAAMPQRHEGKVWYAGRDALHAAVSSDDGKTWSGFREVYLDPYRNESPLTGDSGTAYPFATPTDDGRVLVITGQARARAMLRVDPDWLEQTDAASDFTGAQPLDRWSIFKSVGPVQRVKRDRVLGARLTTDPDKQSDQPVLHLARPDEHDPDGAVWNFPLARQGVTHVRLKLLAGFQGASIGLADCFFQPTDLQGEQQAIFRLNIKPNGQLNGGGRLQIGVWHDLQLRWNLDAQNTAADVVIDGQSVGRIKQLNHAVVGINYLRLRSIAERIDTGGFIVESVSQRGQSRDSNLRQSGESSSAKAGPRGSH